MKDATDLCEFEIQILRECAGEMQISPWGAAVGAALERLKGSGYISGGKPTAKGMAVLNGKKT